MNIFLIHSLHLLSLTYSSRLLDQSPKRSSCCMFITDILNAALYKWIDLGFYETRIYLLTATKYETLLKLLKSVLFLDKESFPLVLVVDNLGFFASLDKNKLGSREGLGKLDKILTLLESILLYGRSINNKFS